MSDDIAVRQIALNVVINGTNMAGAVRLELFQNGSFSADRFVVSMAFAGPEGASYYAGLSTALISISITDSGVAPGAGSNLIVGQIDNVEVDFGARIATLSGRDLSARLIDAEVNQSFANQTASDIATSFALAAGLTANSVPTQTPVGQYYELSYTRTALGLHTRSATQWDLLAALAEIEAYTLSVTAMTLNFVPFPAAIEPVTLTYGKDLVSLSIDRAASLSNAQVMVRSWNTRLKTAHVSSQGTGMSTTLIRPNLMPDQVSNIASAKQAELAGQTCCLRATMPGETNLVPQTWINLQGTSTSFDRNYLVQAVERYVDAERGFIQVVEAYAAG